MKEKKQFMVIAVGLIVVLSIAGGLYQKLGSRYETSQTVPAGTEKDGSGTKEAQAESSDAEEELQPAPDFTVYDPDGREVRLSDLQGKPVVLNFWASWCGPCQSEMPAFEELYAELGEEIHFMMVNCTGGRETEEAAVSFIEKSGYSFPVYYDLDMDAAFTYSIYSLPTTYFIDAEGNAVIYGNGAMDKDTLMQGIDMIYPQ